MSSDDQFSYRRRKIGETLRRYREERNLTQDAAARLTERSPATLSAYENGHRAVRPRDLSQILDRYGVTDEAERRRLLDLATQGRRTGWWVEYLQRAHPFIVDHASLEAEASRIRAFETQVFPGLLQSEEYTRAIFTAYDAVATSARPAGALSFRMERQRILQHQSLRASWIVSETALHTRLGGRQVMKGQLEKVLDVTATDHLDLRLLPFAVGGHPGLDGSFTIMDIGAENPMKVVTVHSLTRSSIIDGPADVHQFERTFDVLLALALSRSDSRKRLSQVASEL